MMEIAFGRVENVVEDDINADKPQFLPFPYIFFSYEFSLGIVSFNHFLHIYSF